MKTTFVRNTPNFVKKVKRVFNRIFHSPLFNMISILWRASPVLIIVIFLITLLQGLLPFLNAWVAKLLIDQIVNSLAQRLINWDLVIWLLIIRAILAATNPIFSSTKAFLTNELNRKLTLIVDTLIFEKLDKFTGIAHFEKPETLNLIQLAQQSSQQGAGQLLYVIESIVRSAVALFSFIGALLLLSPILTVLVIVPTIPHLYIYLKLGHQRFNLTSEMTAIQRQGSYIRSILSQPHFVKEIRLFELGKYFMNKMFSIYKITFQAQRSQEIKHHIWGLTVALISILATSLAYTVMVIDALVGRITIGDVSFYTNALSSVQDSLLGIATSIARTKECVLYHKALMDLLAMPQDLTTDNPPRSIESLKSGIELRHVSFRYSENLPWILRDVNLFIPAGKCVALVGINGAGKSTLMKLLTRLYDPTEGSIFWDGTDIRHFAPSELRQQIGMIFQDFVRYDLTAEENIGLGDVQNIQDSSRIHQASRMADLHKDICKLQRGYKTLLSLTLSGEGEGINLSGGQWQRIALARVFMRQSDLYIFDEPSSNLDAGAEHDMYKNIVSLVKQRTSLIISHRFSTVSMAEIIAVLENGTITECGSHNELIAAKGTYSKLYSLQAANYFN